MTASHFRVDRSIRIGDVVSIILAITAALWTVSKISSTTELLGERIEGLRSGIVDLKGELAIGRERDREHDRSLSENGGRLSSLEAWRAEHLKDVERGTAR